jgi:1-acyl-sn-glycerol-3-phosphate acyltransferase
LPTSAPDPETAPFRWWRLFWKLALPPLRLLARLGWRLRVVRESEFPAGPVIVAANHPSQLDPIFVGVAVDRPMRVLAVDGLWGVHRWLNVVLRGSASIPVTRDRAPLGAMRAAAGHLRAGGSIGVFPEGGVVDGWGSVDLHPSAAWLSLRSGAPVVPVAVVGSAEAYGHGASRLRRSQVTVTVGSPLDPSAFREYDDPSAAMMEVWAGWVGERVGGE